MAVEMSGSAGRLSGTTERPDTAVAGTVTGRTGRLFAVRVLSYLTNHVINRLPSLGARRLWYRRVLGVALGEGTAVHIGCRLFFYGPSQVRRSGLRIGPNTSVGRDCCLDSRHLLEIGANVSISPEVTVLTTGHRYDEPGFQLESRPVLIEDHVWIGMRAMILPGSRIRRGAVVAAGAVVAGEVPPLTVVAGVPAKPIRKRPESALDYVLDQPFPLFE